MRQSTRRKIETARKTGLIGAGLLVAGLATGPLAADKVETCPAPVSGSANALKNNLGSRIRSHTAQIIQETGAKSGERVAVGLTARIDVHGSVTKLFSYAICGGKKCPNTVEPHKIAGISCSGLPPVGAPNKTCDIRIHLNLPAN